VFYQSGISWEWGIVFGMAIVFTVWCEIWKLIRRRLYKRWTPVVSPPIPSDEVGVEKVEEKNKSGEPVVVGAQ